MEKTMPYAASSGWYAGWLRAIVLGLGKEAISFANDTAGIRGKDFARCLIKVNGADTLLSIAIEGGAGTLKNNAAVASAGISEHGNWRHVHSGALNAAYGKAPYFQHIYPLLEEVYESDVTLLRDFNLLVHGVAERIILGNGVTPDFIREAADPSSPSFARGREIAAQIDRRLSIFDALMRFGHETLIGLSAMGDNDYPENLHILKNIVI